MHTLDLGLFKYMLDYTKALLLDQCGSRIWVIVEQRLASIPRYSGLKIMKNGLDIMRMTANDYRNIMKVIIFVLDNLYMEQRDPGVTNEDLVNVFYHFNKMYMATRLESYSKADCDKLQVLFILS